MAITETYSKRKRRAQQTSPEVYQFDSVPAPLRVQVRRILEDSIGAPFTMLGTPNESWDVIRDAVARELGRLTLAGKKSAPDDCVQLIHEEENTDYWLDLVEVAMSFVDTVGRKHGADRRRHLCIKEAPDDAIEELNYRFREASLGYQYESGDIVRVDSQYVHSEVVKPALQLLSDPRFKGAQEEFLAAHGHYRAGEFKDCVTDALNAFESTLKVICDAREWEYGKGARASDLIKIVRAKGLLPDYLDNSFDQLVATLQSGLPKVRNEAGGHGQGATPRETPSYVAAYALHLAAAKIVLLVEAFGTRQG